MTSKATWEKFRDGARTRAIAHQKASTFKRSLYQLLLLSAAIFALLGGSSLINAAWVQSAAVFSLIAAACAAALQVEDLQTNQEIHHSRAAEYAFLEDEANLWLNRIEMGVEPSADDGTKWLTARKALDADQPGAPGWVYCLARREVTKARDRAAPAH